MVALVLGAGIFAVSPAAQAAELQCTLVIDHATGKEIVRQGICDKRFTPMSTFKLPLALMGYDAGVLENEHRPLWDYKPEYKAVKRARKPVDPTIWEADSIVWYSQKLTRTLGEEAFERYVSDFGYGNADVKGLPGGEDGLTHAWLMSSLQISPLEQAQFVRRMLSGQLPVSANARAMTMRIIPAFKAEGGWTLHGKTGSGWVGDQERRSDRSRTIGWFVGWAERGDRTVVFVRMRVRDNKKQGPEGLALRDAFVKELPPLMEGK